MQNVGKGERQLHCLLLHPSVLKVQVEPYSLSSAWVLRGEQEERKGSKKEGRAEMEGQEWNREEGEDSW